jgi:hypothetical protein
MSIAISIQCSHILWPAQRRIKAQQSPIARTHPPSPQVREPGLRLPILPGVLMCGLRRFVAEFSEGRGLIPLHDIAAGIDGRDRRAQMPLQRDQRFGRRCVRCACGALNRPGF